jgi:single-stranded DNA-binding protein
MNVWIIGGRLTKDPVVKTVNDKEIYNFSLAVNETKDSTLFVECDFWGSRGQFLTKLTKGTYLTVQGRFKKRVWTTKEGVEKTVIGCNVDNVFLGNKVENTPKRPEPEVRVEEPDDNNEAEEDDIPF